MAILKKIKASTLMETLVATVLIVIVFILSSMILNNVFLNTIKNNTMAIEGYLTQLQYLYLNEKLSIPHNETFDKWEISIDRFEQDSSEMIEFEATNTTTNKSISLTCYEIK